MYTQLIHPWEIEIFFQMIRLIPNYGYTQTPARASQLIYSGNKTATSCRDGVDTPRNKGNPCHRGPDEPGRRTGAPWSSAATCWSGMATTLSGVSMEA